MSDQGEGLLLAIQATDSSPSMPGSWTMMEFSSNLDQSSQLQVPLVFDQVDSASDERPAFQPCQLLLVPEPDVSLQLLQTLLDNSLLAATQPNLQFNQPLFDPTDQPASPSIFKLDAWTSLLKDYPDPDVVAQVLGAIQHGVVLGYKGQWLDDLHITSQNLPMKPAAAAHVRKEIED